MVWSSAKREIYFHIGKIFLLFFFQLQLLWAYWVFTSYFMILKIFYVSLSGRFQFWAPTCFLQAICPRYDPAIPYDRVQEIRKQFGNQISEFMKKWVVWGYSLPKNPPKAFDFDFNGAVISKFSFGKSEEAAAATNFKANGDLRKKLKLPEYYTNTETVDNEASVIPSATKKSHGWRCIDGWWK